jgi:O-antigen ligase
MRDGPVLLRRLLLALATTLIVARPLVIGEDPGLTINLSDPWSLVLVLLWLFAAVGWAAWRYWLRPSSADNRQSRDRQGAETSPPPHGRGFDGSLNPQHWYGGPVQTALLATVAIVFISAEWAAHYKFPARLIAWEWFGLLITFFLVRQLAVTPREQHGLFAVVLAGAAALAAQGIYQAIVELPQNRSLAAMPDEVFLKIWREENPGQEVNEGSIEQLRLRALQNNIYGPYAHPNNYAGFLVLWLPGMIGAIAVCRRMHVLAWQIILTICFAGVGLTALWLTHSRGAIVGLTAAGAGVGLFVYRRPLRAHALPALIGLLVMIGLLYGGWRSGLFTTGVGKSGNTVAQRLEYWETTWRMIRERPWLGVGPGNFGENYPRLMPETAEEKIKDPHNFALEMWATCGVFALLALLTGLAVFFVQIVRDLGRAESDSDRREALGTDTPDLARAPVRWEFYLGGMLGLLLGFVLRISTATPGAILTETYSAGLRALVWFGAFGLFERIYWSDRGRVLALTTGIVALLLNLCVSGGIGVPSVAGPLLIALALALNASSLRPSPWLSRAGAAMILPLPIFLGLFLGYGIYILYPILASDSLVREAVEAVVSFNSEKDRPPAQPSAFIQKRVVEPLEQAARQTRDDARIYAQLAWWTDVVWNLKRQRSRTSDVGIAERALLYGVRATQLDPRGAPGYLVQYRLRMEYATLNEDSANKARQEHGDPLFIGAREQTARDQYKLAAQIVGQFLPNDPHDTALHYNLALAWFKAGDKDKGRQHAEEALRLDELLTLPTRKLADRQRKQLRAWIKSPPAS